MAIKKNEQLRFDLIRLKFNESGRFSDSSSDVCYVAISRLSNQES